MYRVIIDKRAKKEIDKIPLVYAKKIAFAIYDLEENPRPVGCKKLIGYDNTYVSAWECIVLFTISKTTFYMLKY